ncbi:MFS transporter [Streptosporangium sp. NPDC050855]|uniref:MFS transporter n=1 Tax=Streptosporangium sp. NPDC050855 TaxID=3366194 RepID=UPI0037B7BC52
MHASSSGGTAVPSRPSRSSRATRFAFAALLAGMFMAQLDGNVVVAALPAMAADLRSGGAIAAVTAVYLLTVTVSTPVHGKLGDLLGRRAVFHGALLIFAAGSLACALAPSLPALIAARAVQGVGGGGLVVTAISALAQMFTREELIRRQGYLIGVMALSSLAGPPLGGLLAAGPGWRWIFTINLPLCAVAALLALRGLPGRPPERARTPFDLAGALLVAAVGGGTVALGASESLARSPLGAGAGAVVAAVAVCAVLFVRTERRAAEPLIPPSLFADRGLARSIVATGLAGVALFGTFAFVPMAVQEGTGADGGRTGLLLLALTGGQLAATSAFSVLARRRPAVTGWGRLALVMGVAGTAALALLPALHQAPRPLSVAIAVLGMALAGGALGLSMQAYTLIAQGRARPEQIGAAMGTLTFARQLGGSLGTAAFGWILLVAPGTRAGLTLVLATAAACLLAALLVSPRTEDDPAPRPSRDVRVQEPS